MSTREVILIAASQARSTAHDEESILRDVEDLVRQHTGLVYRIAYSALRDHHDAEDAVQETFLRVVRYRAQLKRVNDRKSWLAQIAWRAAVEMSGRRKRRTSEEPAEALANAIGAGPSAEDTLMEEQIDAMLASFIAVLPSDLRDVITLSTVQELNSREIGAVLGIPETTVRTRQMRARQELKEKFAAVLKRK